MIYLTLPLQWNEFDLCIGVSDSKSSIIKDFVISLDEISCNLLCRGDSFICSAGDLEYDLELDTFLSLPLLPCLDADLIGS